MTSAYWLKDPIVRDDIFFPCIYLFRKVFLFLNSHFSNGPHKDRKREILSTTQQPFWSVGWSINPGRCQVLLLVVLLATGVIISLRNETQLCWENAMISLLGSWDLCVKNYPAQSKERNVLNALERKGGGAAAGMTENWLCPMRCFYPATPGILGENINLTKVLAGMKCQWKAVQTSCASNVHLGLRQKHRATWGN